MTFFLIVLGIAAGYSGGMYLIAAVTMLRCHAANYEHPQHLTEEYTFHLGLCFILSVGFIGLILK